MESAMNMKIKLSSQMEDYLEAIYHLCRDEGVARVKAIADRLEVTTPSVVGAIRNSRIEISSFRSPTVMFGSQRKGRKSEARSPTGMRS